MPTRRLSSDELWRRGDDLYDNHIRPRVETEENIGKLIQIDVATGDYEIGTDREAIILTKEAMAMTDRLFAKNADAQIIELRIGYPAVSVLPFPRLHMSKNL